MEEEHAAQNAFEYAQIPGDNPWGIAVRARFPFIRQPSAYDCRADGCWAWQALIVAGLRAEEVPRVRQLLDEMGGHSIKVLPVRPGGSVLG